MRSFLVINQVHCLEELHGTLDTDRFILIVGNKRAILKPVTLSFRKNTPDDRCLRDSVGSRACEDEDRKSNQCRELNAVHPNSSIVTTNITQSLNLNSKYLF